MVDGVREEVVYIWFYGRLSSSEIHGLIHDLKTSLRLLCLGQTGRDQGENRVLLGSWWCLSLWGDGQIQNLVF